IQTASPLTSPSSWPEPQSLFPAPLKHDQAALFLYMSCIQEHSPFFYTHLSSNFFSNQPVFHHYSQLRCKYPSPISPPTPPAAFNMSAATPDSPAALPLFALEIANLTSAADITLSSTDVSTSFISLILSLFHSNFSFNNRS